MTFFESTDLVRFLQCQTDIVETIQHAVLAESIDLERITGAAICRADDLLLQIDHQTEARECLDFIEQMVDLRFTEHDRQQAVFVAVVKENIGKTRGQNRTEAILAQRPGSVLTRRTATEVLAGQQYRSTLVTRLIQYKILIQGTIRVVLSRLAD